MKKYELLDHTGDIRIRAFGSSKAELFSNAATAMMELLFGKELPEAAGAVNEELQITSADSEALLVDWLSELLFRSSLHRACCVSINIVALTDTELLAKLAWVEAEAIEEIKAVTYYKLKILHDASGWSVRVTFDV